GNFAPHLCHAFMHGLQFGPHQDANFVQCWCLPLETSGFANLWQDFVAHPPIESLGLRLAARAQYRIEPGLGDDRTRRTALTTVDTIDGAFLVVIEPSSNIARVAYLEHRADVRQHPPGFAANKDKTN